MPRTQTVPARPRVLRWAREQMNLSIGEAAERLGVTSEELRAVESDTDETIVPAAVLRRMQQVYHRTRSVLLLPEPPRTRGKVELRTARGARSATERTLLAIRDVKRLQRFLSDAAVEDAELFPLTSIGSHDQSEDPESAASTERRRLGVPIDEQLSWTRQAQALDAWRDAMTRRGVAVTKKSMPWNECRGVSIAGDDLIPFIVLNTQDTFTAMCFTIAHEYGHLVLGIGSACALGQRSDDEGIEQWCNSFAAALLMPREYVVIELADHYADVLPDQWTVKLVERFARRFKVSPMAAARRLATVADVPFYRDNSSDLWGEERIHRREEGRGGGELAEERAVREYGVELIEAVLEAVHRGVADGVEAGDAIGVLASRFTDLEAEMQKRA